MESLDNRSKVFWITYIGAVAGFIIGLVLGMVKG